MVSGLATEGQTVFTVQGGYIINHISVFRNGVRLSPAEDFTAGDGSTVTLNNAANIDDRIDFHIFDRFTVQNAIVGAASTQTINGDLVLNGKLFGQLDVPSINLTGIITATELDLNGKADISSDLNVAGVSTFTGAVDANGGATIDNITIGVANDNEINTSTGQLTLDSALGQVVVDDRLMVIGISTFTGNINSSGGNITLGDSGGASDDRIVFGAGSDLSIYHDGTDSFIDNSTGGLKLLGDVIRLKGKSADETIFRGVVNDTAELYFNNTLRLKTYDGGIDVFSNINATGFSSCSGNSNVGGEPPWAQASSYGRSLSISGSGTDGTGHLKLGNGAATTNADFDLSRISIYNGATEVARITGETGDSNNDSGQIMFDTKESGGSLTERLILSREGYLIPSTDSTYDLGTNSTRFRNIYADTLYGDGSNLSNITSTTINNNANNRVITGSGTANTLEGESGLLFDGTDTLEIGTAAGGSGYDSNMKLRIGRASDAQICIRNTSGDTNYGGLVFGDNSSSFGGGIQYHHNGDSLRFYTAGSTERIRISSTGQLLVGTTSSSYKLHVDSTSLAAEISVDNDASNYLVALNTTNSVNADFNVQHKANTTSVGTGVNVPLCFHINGGTNANSAEKMRLDTSGSLLIGAASYGGGGAAPALYISNSGGRQVKIHNTSAGTCGIQLTNSFTGEGEDAGPQIFCSGGGAINISNATHMSDGNATHEFYAKNGSGTNKLIHHLRAWGYSSHLSTNSLFNLNTAQDGNGSDYFVRGSKNSTTPGGGNDVFWIYEDGDMYNVNGTFSQSSDQKLKENIVDASSQWDDFKALKFRKFNFKASTGYQTHTQLGLIAQEVELVSPGLVKDRTDLVKTTDENGKVTETDTGEVTKGIKQSVLYMKGMKALQEAMTRIETLESENTALKARVPTLEGS